MSQSYKNIKISWHQLYYKPVLVSCYPRKSNIFFHFLFTLQARLNEVGKCDICTMWKFKSGETWGEEFQENASPIMELLDVGVWTPRDGLRLSDVLFPHIEQGFRQKNLPVISFHVSPLSKWWKIFKKKFVID